MTDSPPVAQDVPLATRVSRETQEKLTSLADKIEKESGYRPSISEMVRRFVERGVDADLAKRRRGSP